MNMTDPSVPEGNRDFSRALSERLFTVLPSVITEERETLHKATGNTPIGEPPASVSVTPQEIIRSYANRNITLGMEATNDFFNAKTWPHSSLAEVALITANHIRMLYHIGKTYGKEETVLELEFLTTILFRAIDGSDSDGFLRIEGNRTVFHRPDEANQGTFLSLYSEKVARNLGKARIVQFLPEVAQIALAAWGMFSSDEIGRRGIEFLSREAVISSGGNRPTGQTEKTGSGSFETEGRCNVEKVKLLVNLLKDDHVPEDRKAALVEPFLRELRLDEVEAHRLQKKVPDTKLFKVDLLVFQQQPARKIDLMVDLVGLAFFDQKINPNRTIFVKNTGRDLGFSTDELERLLDDGVQTIAFKKRLFSFGAT